jgi:hypothetical protein
MENNLCRALPRVAALLFFFTSLTLALHQFSPIANSQALPQPRPAHVERELKFYQGHMILSSFFHDVTTQQPATGEKTVEQVYKNIQILKGTPASQLQPLMNYIAGSLGVKCDFCHVNKDGDGILRPMRNRIRRPRVK